MIKYLSSLLIATSDKHFVNSLTMSRIVWHALSSSFQSIQQKANYKTFFYLRFDKAFLFIVDFIAFIATPALLLSLLLSFSFIDNMRTPVNSVKVDKASRMLKSFTSKTTIKCTLWEILYNFYINVVIVVV